MAMRELIDRMVQTIAGHAATEQATPFSSWGLEDHRPSFDVDLIVVEGDPLESPRGSRPKAIGPYHHARPGYRAAVDGLVYPYASLRVRRTRHLRTKRVHK